MALLLKSMLVAGLIFPAVSWLTFMASRRSLWRHKKRASSVFIPFVGPLLLTIWVVCAGKPLWLMAIAWGADIGTLAFLFVSPRLIKDWWQTSCFTRTLKLQGSQGEQSAIITFHSTGQYLLKKSWHRPRGQTGIAGLGEPGTSTQSGGEYQLTSHAGLRRTFRRTDQGAYVVEEELPGDALRDYSLKQWVLSPVSCRRRRLVKKTWPASAAIAKDQRAGE